MKPTCSPDERSDIRDRPLRCSRISLRSCAATRHRNFLRCRRGGAGLTTKTYRLRGADGRSHQSATKGLFGGNARLKIYGRLDCASALRAIARGPTYARHRVFFADEASAIAAGFRPCAVCMRAAYLKWKAAKQKNNLPARPNTKQSTYQPNKKS